MAQRLWHLFAYLNMFVLTGAAVLTMLLVAPDGHNEGRPRIALPVQLVFGIVAAAYVLALSLVGGAVLARYLLPVYPLVVIECVSTLWRRLSWWKPAVAVVALALYPACSSILPIGLPRRTTWPTSILCACTRAPPPNCPACPSLACLPPGRPATSCAGHIWDMLASRFPWCRSAFQRRATELCPKRTAGALRLCLGLFHEI